MKISVCMVMMAMCLSSLVQHYSVEALGYCSVSCPAGCQERRNCDGSSCICSCDCSANAQLPNPRQTPIINPNPNPTIPQNPAYQYPRQKQPQTNLPDQIPCCVQASTKMGVCGIYIGLAFLNPTLNFGSFCCGVLKDLQQCCVNGFIPPDVPRVNIYAIDLDAHCH